MAHLVAHTSWLISELKKKPKWLERRNLARFYTDSRGRHRDAKKEYERDHSSTKAKQDRAARNTARRQAIKKYGKEALQGKDVSHRSPLSRSKNPSKVSWKIESTHRNRGKDNKKLH